MMRRLAIVGLFASGLCLAMTAAPASAQTSAPRAPAVGLAQAGAAPAAESTPPRRGLRWTQGGRWGLNLNARPTVGRETEWGDVEAGAYYRLNPRLSLGASADLGRADEDPARATQTDRRSQPRVRLESIFKF